MSYLPLDSMQTEPVWKDHLSGKTTVFDIECGRFRQVSLFLNTPFIEIEAHRYCDVYIQWAWFPSKKYVCDKKQEPMAVE